MSRDFPDWIDPDRAAAARRVFSGTIPLSRLQRLVGIIADPGDSEVGFRMDIGHDGQRQVRVDIEVWGSVRLRCQRTLEVFEYALESRSVVGIVTTDQAADALPEDYEPLLCTTGRVELLRLVEEEVLLALPLVPVSPHSERVGGQAGGRDTHRPFAGLAQLRRKGNKD